jgi:hypothetical protein
LLELLAAMAVMLIVSGAIFSVLIAHQKSYTSTTMKANMHAGLRSATELLAQEIGQAGLLAPPCASPAATCTTAITLQAAVSSSSSAQTVSVSSTTGMYVGEILQIDVGSSNQEAVTLLSPIGSSTIKGIFANSHNSGALVTAVGVFPNGVLTTAAGNRLELFGDINGDGNMVYVRYDCDTTAGTLKRSVTPITASTINTAEVLLYNLAQNGTNCFQATTQSIAGYTLTTSVGVTLTLQTTEIDPQTGNYAQEKNTFSNLTPRNIVMGVTLSNASLTDHLQPTPQNVTTNLQTQ